MNIGEYDQIETAVKEIAPILFMYYTSLLNSGFSEKQSFELTNAFHSEILKGALSNGRSK